MPIRIRIKKLVPWHNDAADQIKVDMLNSVAEEFAGEARKELGGMNCEHHPARVSVVTIVPDRAHQMVIAKKFCCPEFERKISLKLDR